jgi:dephospho-CoA kinase
MVLGLSGKCCAGKDEAAAILRERGWEIIDVDAVGHEALGKLSGEVAAEFGEHILSADGTVDRKRLGSIVFSDRERLTRLEEILHPEMKRMVAGRVERIRQERGTAATERICINAALLFPMGLHRLCDAVLRVKAPLPLRFIRAKRRDRAPLRFLLKRFRGQRSLFPKHLLEDVDMYTVENCGSRKRLERSVVEILERIEDEVFGSDSAQ